MKTAPLLTVLTATCFALGAARPVAPARHTVTVVVTALASTQSAVKLTFYNAPEKFLKDGQHAHWVVVRPAGKRAVTVPIELAAGEWAVALTQDTNNNDKLDKNLLGIPTEPYAFSNNVRPRLAPPKFAECKFTVNGPGKVVSIALQE